MREYERYEPVKTAPQPQRNYTRVGLLPQQRRPKVNKAAVVLGDPWVVLGGFLRVFSRRK